MRLLQERAAIICALVCLYVGTPAVSAAEPTTEYLSDMVAQGRLTHEQQWGVLGVDIAARSRGPEVPIRIAAETFSKGLGHHANGRITIPLAGAYQAFHARIGVQWQGGKRGSVRFRVLVDGKLAFEHGPMSDSDASVPIDIALAGAAELCLVADDNGNGIGCDMATWAEACLTRDPDVRIVTFGPIRATLCGRPAPAPSGPCAGGVALIAAATGPQLLVLGEPVSRISVSLRGNEEVSVSIPVNGSGGRLCLAAEVTLQSGSAAAAVLTIGETSSRRALGTGQTVTLESGGDVAAGSSQIAFSMRGLNTDACVRLERLRYQLDDPRWLDLPLRSVASAGEPLPPPRLPEIRPDISQELIEWDWRRHDGIGTPLESVSYPDAVASVLARGDRLVAELGERGGLPAAVLSEWQDCRRRTQALALAGTPDAGMREWEQLWLRVHTVRRRLVFANPVFPRVPILFVKQVPSGFSHQLTQYYGMWARPGGGVFVLDSPGTSMACRELTDGQLPVGSYQHPELSYDGRRVLFAYCSLESGEKTVVAGWRLNADTYYHLYEIGADGKGLRQITSGPADDFFPTCLPAGRILFCSTRRGGYHRCGHGPCPVYTLASVNADGSDPRVLSCHETQEWDPAVLNDGRVIYTRWDYVDRNAVYYQQLWTTRPDGSAPSEYFGNYLRNPVGVWEARPIPGVNTIMATAGAHHAMTAGSIIRIDITRGLDNPAAITRLTPDVPFPESECTVLRSRNGAAGWRGTAGVREQRPEPQAQKRWPGHCYRSPYPLSETTFLAAYSHDPLLGEPSANSANMFGLYVVDCYGNRELLYRDPNISSLWPIPLRPRRRPVVLPDVPAEPERQVGTFVVQNVNRADPPLPGGADNSIKRLRIVQVLPKTTPHANNPRVGKANASPGKQVLGTVPVEPDGSAHFLAPVNTPLLFQALDGHGRSVQSMRSVTYLQPGEVSSCIGCHEPRLSAPPLGGQPMATQRPPSDITPGPDGSNPFSYPLLVQPVLDKHCVSCHSGTKPAGDMSLTAKPGKQFSESYDQLITRVSYSSWGRRDNSEPMSQPDHFGARGSVLMKHLLQGHKKVQFADSDLERLVTWMDTTALFYGTFKPEDQARQLKGERIDGPDLE